MSVGENTNIEELGHIPSHIIVQSKVNQLEVLQYADVFLSHSGMNSVNESLYFGVSLVLYPQHGEEKMVANRVIQLGAGILLKDTSFQGIMEATKEVLDRKSYEENAQRLSKGIRNSGGAKKAAEAILSIATTKTFS